MQALDKKLLEINIQKAAEYDFEHFIWMGQAVLWACI